MLYTLHDLYGVLIGTYRKTLQDPDLFPYVFNLVLLVCLGTPAYTVTFL